MADENGWRPIAEGDWVVIGKMPDWHPRVTSFEAAQVVKVTAKLVYADAHYRKQHPIEHVIRMPDEHAARLLVDRAKSAYAESAQRERAAWKAYNKRVAELLPPPPEPAGGAA
jgi:hypothetical protein